MKTIHNIDANGFEIEKIRKPYGKAPKETKKFKKEKRIRRDTIRGN